MENELFLNAGSRAAAMPIWPLAMEIQVANEMNCSSEQSSDCFFNPNNWEKSTDLNLQFDSALRSMVSSTVASNSNIFNEISPHALAPLNINGNTSAPHNINGNNSTKTSCYTTPLNSPPKMDHFVKEPRLANSLALNSSVADFSAHLGFAERAARFSLFGSRNFNGRTRPFVPYNNPEFGIRSNPLMANEKLPRVVSSPSLKVLGSQGNQNSSELANSQEETSVSEQVPNGDAALKTSNVFDSKKRKAVSKGKGKEPIASPSSKVVESNDNSHNKRCKPNEGNANENGAVMAGEEPKGDAKNAGDDEQARATNAPEPPKDYIHVRARRGQATDSHSLAERVRREKISERMKLLQDLVPGCNNVTGKAVMLDEIINYVRSLQQKVEFLSMKLASVNTRLDFNVDALMSKDMYQPNKPLPHSVFPIDSSASAFFGHQPRQNPALHSNISNGTMTQRPADPLDNTICRNLNMQLPPLDQFTEIIPQFPNFCQNDLQSLVQMGFGQNPSRETSLLSQSFHGSNQASHLKVEL